MHRKRAKPGYISTFAPVRSEPPEPAGRRHDRLQLYLPLHPLHDVHQTEHPEGAGLRSLPSRQQAGRQYVAPGPQQIQVVNFTSPGKVRGTKFYISLSTTDLL